MDDIHDMLTAIEKESSVSILTTVINVEGSAYRKEGTTMLFTASGLEIGVISAGCLEEDLRIRAKQLMRCSRNVEAVIYDMSAEDDLTWGRGAGCNGKIHILLEKIDDTYKRDLMKVKKHLEQGMPILMLKLVEEDSTKTIFMRENKYLFGSYFDLPVWFNTQAQRMMTSYMKDNIFIHHFIPKPRLFLFGAGPDVRSLASMATCTGFSVHVWDWRMGFLKKEYFPNATLMAGAKISAATAIERASLSHRDATVIMTHDFQKDRDILHTLLEHDGQQYIGILGPRQRTARLLAGKPIPEKVHSPVGLDIGAEGPEEIAVSIIAELIQAQRFHSIMKGDEVGKYEHYRHLSSSR